MPLKTGAEGTNASSPSSPITNFSLVLGGPLYQLYLRTRLSTPPLGLLRRRILTVSLLCWFPLLILSLTAGQALRGVVVPFLLDPEVHVRFLAAVPLLIIAESIVHQRIISVVSQFVERNLVSLADRIRFEHIIASTMRLRNSVLLEILLLVFCFTVGHWAWRQEFGLKVSTWYAPRIERGMFLSKAGYWYVFLSLPIFRFLLFRWYFRLFLWYQFLWRVRGLPLQLNLYHPDRAAGLGFLAASVAAFAPVMLAQTTLLAGMIGDRIWHTGASLLDFKMEIVALLLFLMLLLLMPLCFFVFQLDRARRVAKRELGILSSEYVNRFRYKWIQRTLGKTESLLGTSDIQSLADLGNSFKTVADMRLIPFGKNTIIGLGGFLLLPLLPLFLTIIPLRNIVDWIIRLAF